MSNVITTLSSVGTSRPVNLDWVNAEPIGVVVTGSSSGTFTFAIQTTLDDLQQITSSSVVWITDPNFSAATVNSSAVILYTAPLAGIRVNAAALSSAVLTLRVNQGTI